MRPFTATLYVNGKHQSTIFYGADSFVDALRKMTLQLEDYPISSTDSVSITIEMQEVDDAAL